MTDPMLHTAIALLTAHLLADFVFQPDAMVLHKRNPGVLALHGAIVLVLTLAALGGHPRVALGIAVTHVAIDAVKVFALPDRLWAFLTDQSAHIATLIVALWLVPAAYDTGVWRALPPDTLRAAIFACGLIATTLAGGPAVGLLMARFKAEAQPQGLENAGRIIGLLERALIFMMVLIEEPAAIGFLIAAKSILRFDTVKQSQQVSEYVIIGTLASFGWALIMAFATRAALEML